MDPSLILYGSGESREGFDFRRVFGAFLRVFWSSFECGCEN